MTGRRTNAQLGFVKKRGRWLIDHSTLELTLNYCDQDVGIL